MVKKTIPQLDDGESQVASDSIVVFTKSDGTTLKSKVSTLVHGPTVKYVHSINDFPAIVGGFIKLEQDTVYVICAEILIGLSGEKILIPAGWNGTIYSTHVPKNSLIYVGTAALFNTLNIDGTVDSIAVSGTNPTTHSTITSVAHGLSDGDTVNIRDTVDTLYSQPRLVISNITTDTFDVEIVFVLTDAGTWDTGYLGIQFPRMALFDSGVGTLFDITATPDPTSIFAWNDVAIFNWLSLGIIRKAPNVNLLSGILTFIDNGLTLEDCVTVGIHHSNLANINPANTTSKCLTLTGDATRDVILDSTKLNVANSSQRPIRIDPSITNADDIVIQNSPDNNVATDYFDESSGGLNQKDKQVRAFNNGKRKDSVEQCEAISNVVITVDATTVGNDDPIENSPETANDFALDSSVEGFTINDSTGKITYDGRAPITVKIEYSLDIRHLSGGTHDVVIHLHLNETLQNKTSRAITTATSFAPVSYNGGFFDINPGDRFQLFRTSDSDSVDLEVQNLVVLIK